VSALELYALTCPQCGAAGVVREGTRITECDRCGARLCLTEVSTPRYEAVPELTATEALARVRAWLAGRGSKGTFGRPELLLIPLHEIAGRRVGVFERKLPVRREVLRTVYSAEARGPVVESRVVYDQRRDTKVMVADVHYLTPAARTPWDLTAFDATEARRRARLRTFDLVEAQRRATVYAEERTADAHARARFPGGGPARLVAVSRRTLFFPFWSIPVESRAGSYEVVVDGVTGAIVAWRLPEIYRGAGLTWALLAVPGALGLGQALRAVLFDAAVLDPAVAFTVGVLAVGAALWRSNRPDWRVRSWPEPDTVVRLQRERAE
jgi:hypothetical protein